MRSEISAGLNPEQLRAVETLRGPVCILAGAGSGKTTTITRRIAHQMIAGAFKPTEILAVTFTRKAAEELRSRLATLGAPGIQARTFHSAADRQLRYFSGERRQVVESKVPLLLPIVGALPEPFRGRAVSDIATEIEWAKNRRVGPDAYLASMSGESRTAPLPPEVMTDVYREYERRKSKAGQIDHEDQLELTIRVFEENATARAEFRERYRAFTVDEYQDVNLLQQSLLFQWLGERDDLCVVGDDYQSIFAFTGATPDYLLDIPSRFPSAAVIRLEENYRSTAEILAVANRLAPSLGGAKKILRATRRSGPEPFVRALADSEAEAAFVAERVRELRRRGIQLREIAILYRANFRSSLYEEALLQAGIPFQVKEGAFLDRKAAKSLLPRLERRAGETAVAQVVRDETRQAGYLDETPADLGPAEITRQKDMARFITLAAEFDDGRQNVAAYVQDLRDRFESESERDAVQLMTYHSAKGLEFEAVFLPQLEDREIPHWRQIDQGNVGEERRLFYVGLTRAKRELFMTWSRKRDRSRFLDELFPVPAEPMASGPTGSRPVRDGPPRARGKWSGAASSSSNRETGLAPTSWVPAWMREKKK